MSSFLKGNGPNRILVNSRKQLLLNATVVLPPIWIDNIDASLINTSIASSLSSVIVPVTRTGIATKIRIKIGISNFDGQAFRLAIYSEDGSTFYSWTHNVAINIADSNTLKEFAIDSFSVTAGTNYMLAAYLNGNESNIFGASTSDAHTSLYDHPAFINFPQSSLTGPYFTTQWSMSCGIYIT